MAQPKTSFFPQTLYNRFRDELQLADDTQNRTWFEEISALERWQPRERVNRTLELPTRCDCNDKQSPR